MAVEELTRRFYHASEAFKRGLRDLEWLNERPKDEQWVHYKKDKDLAKEVYGDKSAEARWGLVSRAVRKANEGGLAGLMNFEISYSARPHKKSDEIQTSTEIDVSMAIRARTDNGTRGAILIPTVDSLVNAISENRLPMQEQDVETALRIFDTMWAIGEEDYVFADQYRPFSTEIGKL